jgi:hypothetical protein
MKGVVFTELMELVENKFGFDVVDDLVDQSGLECNYTQAGNYSPKELFTLVTTLSKITKVSVDDLVFTYGVHLFGKLIEIYPEPIKMYDNSFDFIAAVDKVVHPEVKKLYPDAQLPEFETVSYDANKLVVIYKSNNPLAEFAKGLMTGCAEHYNEEINISYTKPQMTNGQFISEFILTK